MSDWIVMSAAQAAGVAGTSTAGHALDPRPLADGRFALPTRVLRDPAHAAKHPALAGFAREGVDPADFVSDD